MEYRKQIQLEYQLVERLSGKIRLLQEFEERLATVDEELTALLREDDGQHFKNEMEELCNEDVKKKFVREFLSYGAIHPLMSDFEVEDIIINAIKPIYIHHSQKGLVSSGICFQSREELDLFVRKLVLFSGRKTIDNIMNIELPNLEGRVNIVASPFGPQLTITKAKLDPLSIFDLIAAGSFTYEVAAQLWLYLEGMSIRPANMIIAGGPGVGKTTLLNALFSFIPENDRIVVIEDTLELNTDFEDSCSRLESGEEFSLADLVKNSLRMRPERIIVGEVRGEEARDMMTAANIGKYCIGTIHALSSREAIIRLQNEPMNIPEELVRLIDVFIVLKRYHVGDRVFRVIDEVSETSGMEQQKVLLSHIYKYDYESRTTKVMSTSTVYRDRLAQQAGLLPKDIIFEVQIRALALKRLADLKLTTLKELSVFCRSYSRNSDLALESIGIKRSDLLEKKYLEERQRRINR
jgi:flagellar protein FlaI